MLFLRFTEQSNAEIDEMMISTLYYRPKYRTALAARAYNVIAYIEQLNICQDSQRRLALFALSIFRNQTPNHRPLTHSNVESLPSNLCEN